MWWFATTTEQCLTVPRQPSRLVIAPSPSRTAPKTTHVYLVSDQREWFLGRVERGARVALRIPDESLAPDAGLMRLVVIMGAQMTPQVARDPRAAIAFSQPASELVRQQWPISQGLLTSEWLRGAGVRIAP